MARYIKANPKVAQFLNLQNDRLRIKDGNYILWQADMLAFGPLTRLSETLASIGAIALMPHEAREEQDGTTLRSLPMASDPRFEILTPTLEETPELVKSFDTTAEQPDTENEPAETPSSKDTPRENPGKPEVTNNTKTTEI